MSSASEGVDRVLDEAAGCVEVGDVRAVGHRLRAERLDLRDDFVRRRRVGAFTAERRAEVVDDDLRACSRERERVLAPDPASRRR